jgi:hypothetical protein
MAKDYRKRNTGRNKGSKPYHWVVIAFLAGFICTSVLDFSAIAEWAKTNLLVKQVGGSQLTKTVAHNQNPQPKFEFILY